MKILIENAPSFTHISIEPRKKLTDDEFFEFCQQNQNLKFERTKHGNIIVMTPTGGRTSSRNSKIIIQLGIWNHQANYGEIFDSNGGFHLPDGSMLAPDAAVVAYHCWETLTGEEQEKFPPICPEFIVELKSKSDRITDLQAKMQDWLIDPDTEITYIYRPGKATEEVSGFDNTLSGDPVLPGFQLDLRVLK